MSKIDNLNFIKVTKLYKICHKHLIVHLRIIYIYIYIYILQTDYRSVDKVKKYLPLFYDAQFVNFEIFSSNLD